MRPTIRRLAERYLTGTPEANVAAATAMWRLEIHDRRHDWTEAEGLRWEQEAIAAERALPLPRRRGWI